jgi:hypothetical protein
MEKRGFHRWTWLIVLLLGGLLMLYGGAQDVTLFFSPEGDLSPVPSWHPIPPLVGLVCGLIALGGSHQRRGDDRRLGQRLLWLWQEKP